MKHLFDSVSNKCSKLTTIAYSTSFSFGIKALDKKLHAPIYGIYGFVRFADEIVDTFHNYDKHYLFKKFKQERVLRIAKFLFILETYCFESEKSAAKTYQKLDVFVPKRQNILINFSLTKSY